MTNQVDKFDHDAGSVPLIYHAPVHEDLRGSFSEAWNREKIPVPSMTAQINHSHSKQWTIRGMHWQVPPFALSKYVTCLFGIIQDVVVDIRKRSKTFGKWNSYILQSDPETAQRPALWVPQGFAHGFLVMSAWAEVIYLQDGLWRKQAERSLNPLDSNLKIEWELNNLSGNARLSDKDAEASLFEELTDDDLFT